MLPGAEMRTVISPAKFFKPTPAFILLVANRLKVQENSLIGSKFRENREANLSVVSY